MFAYRKTAYKLGYSLKIYVNRVATLRPSSERYHRDFDIVLMCVSAAKIFDYYFFRLNSRYDFLLTQYSLLLKKFSSVRDYVQSAKKNALCVILCLINLLSKCIPNVFFFIYL